MKLRVLAEAEAEVESARRWLNEQSSELGSRFLEDLRQAFAAIQARPEGFSFVETLPDGWPYRRAILHTFRYAVIFEIEIEEILVVAVVHTSQEPNFWLGRADF